SLNMLRL
nr:myomodulin, MMF=peptide cotransmitter [Aplysia californica=mollusk, B16 accessory radula closer (ARC) muscle, Peptide, 7 aa] [Aplysia californica]